MMQAIMNFDWVSEKNRLFMRWKRRSPPLNRSRPKYKNSRSWKAILTFTMKSE